MFDMYLINSEPNRKALRELGYNLNVDRGVSYIRVNIVDGIATYSVYSYTSPLFEVNHVAELMVLPDYQTRVFYLLSEKIITGFNPHVPQSMINAYYKMLNSRTYPAPQG